MGNIEESFAPNNEVHLDESNITELLHAQEAVSGPLDDVEKALMIESAMGNDVINFLNTEAGRVLRSEVRQDMLAAQAELTRVAPWRKRRIQQLQNRVKQGESFMGYLATMVLRGEHAYIQLMSANQGA